MSKKNLEEKKSVYQLLENGIFECEECNWFAPLGDFFWDNQLKCENCDGRKIRLNEEKTDEVEEEKEVVLK